MVSFDTKIIKRYAHVEFFSKAVDNGQVCCSSASMNGAFSWICHVAGIGYLVPQFPLNRTRPVAVKKFKPQPLLSQFLMCCQQCTGNGGAKEASPAVIHGFVDKIVGRCVAKVKHDGAVECPHLEPLAAVIVDANGCCLPAWAVNPDGRYGRARSRRLLGLRCVTAGSSSQQQAYYSKIAAKQYSIAHIILSFLSPSKWSPAHH